MIQTLGKQHKQAFCTVLADAFMNDPLFQLVFIGSKQAKHKQAFLEFMFEKSLSGNGELLGFYEEDQLQGAVILDPPKKESFKQTLQLLGLILKLAIHLPLHSLMLLNSYMRLTSKDKTQHYLVMIGVKVEAQGRGIARTLLERCIQMTEASTTSEGLGLDTENSDNLKFYEDFGFQLLSTKALKNISIYCMFRPKVQKRAAP